MNCCAASSFLARIKKRSPAQRVATIRGPTKGVRLSATTGRINASVMKTANDKAAKRVTEYVPRLFFIEELWVSSSPPTVHPLTRARDGSNAHQPEKRIGHSVRNLLTRESNPKTQHHFPDTILQGIL